jgi:hypothetical protein
LATFLAAPWQLCDHFGRIENVCSEYRAGRTMTTGHTQAELESLERIAAAGHFQSPGREYLAESVKRMIA